MNDQTENTQDQTPAVASAGAGGVSTATAHNVDEAQIDETTPETDEGNSVGQISESGDIPAEQNTVAGDTPTLEDVAGNAQPDPVPEQSLTDAVLELAQDYVDQGKCNQLSAVNQVSAAVYFMTQPAPTAEFNGGGDESKATPPGEVSEAA